MIKQKKLFIGIVISFSIVLFYIFLDEVVVLFLNKEMQLHKINFDDYNYDAHVFYHMYSFEYSEEDNLLEAMSCSGWAFVPSKDDSADKRTFIILKGTKGSYITADCGGFYDEIHDILKGWKDIPGGNNRFMASFSTINLPDDIYDIYICIEAGEEIKGISQTIYTFKKEGIHLYEYASKNKMCDELDISSSKGSIDNGWMTVRFESEYIKVSGWATLDLIPSEDMEYFIVFEGNNGSQITMEANKICHTAVVQALNDTLYTESGFCCTLETEQLPDNAGKIYLIIRYEDKYYQSNTLEFCLEDNLEYRQTKL